MLAIAKQKTLQQLLLLFTDPPDSQNLRYQTGRLMLDLLNADHFASYVWQQDGTGYAQGVHLGISEATEANYKKHFQFHDPITHKLQRRARATDVGQVMTYKDLRRTEFFNDFLRLDGLWHGINAHAIVGQQHLGDLRIWRGKHRSAFDSNDCALVEYLRPLFCNALRHTSNRSLSDENHLSRAAELGLSEREQQVALQVSKGLSDKQAAEQLGMAVSTLRTHLRKSYQKLGIHSRTALIAQLNTFH